jgi:hypothetical protein
MHCGAEGGTWHICAQPRFNALDDLAELMEGLAREFAA